MMKDEGNSSFELIKWLYECNRFANLFLLKNVSLGNKSVKWIQKLDKIFLYKHVILNRQLKYNINNNNNMLSGIEEWIYLLQNSKFKFLWKVYSIKAAGLGLCDILLPHALQIDI